VLVLSGQLMAAADGTSFAPVRPELQVLNSDKRLDKFRMRRRSRNSATTSCRTLALRHQHGNTPPELVERHHDAFKKAMEEPRLRDGAEALRLLPNYMGTADYGKFAETFLKERRVESWGWANRH
jgi:hypothetical protein